MSLQREANGMASMPLSRVQRSFNFAGSRYREYLNWVEPSACHCWEGSWTWIHFHCPWIYVIKESMCCLRWVNSLLFSQIWMLISRSNFPTHRIWINCWSRFDFECIFEFTTRDRSKNCNSWSGWKRWTECRPEEFQWLCFQPPHRWKPQVSVSGDASTDSARYTFRKNRAVTRVMSKREICLSGKHLQIEEGISTRISDDDRDSFYA
jgi:hypothetical protein